METPKTNAEIVMQNKKAWNQYTENGCCYTKPVSREIIEQAKAGTWEIILTPVKPVPKDWFPAIQGLKIRDLSCFSNEEFDLVFHPVSNTYVPDVLPVWKEAYRVLKNNGVMLAGFVNPFVYIFDSQKMDMNILEVANTIPCSECQDQESAIEFSHTLETQIGGQIKAGFIIDGFYEDYEPEGIIAKYSPTYIATRAKKARYAARIQKVGELLNNDY